MKCLFGSYLMHYCGSKKLLIIGKYSSIYMSYRKLHIRKLSGALSEADTVLGPWCLSDDDQKGADRLINSYHDPWDDVDLVCQETEKLRKS